MRSSTRNLMIGMFHEMKGTVKAAVGNTMNNRWMAFSGHVERIGGKARTNFGRVERACGW